MSEILPGACAPVTDWCQAQLPMLREADLARWMSARGARIVEARGRYWNEVVPGFFQPLHYLARHHLHEIVSPRRFCWGMRAVLHEAEREQSNVVLPVHVMPDLKDYSLERLDRRRRQEIKKAMRAVDLVILDRPDRLIADGFPLVREATARNPRNRAIAEQHFAAWLEAAFAGPGPIVLVMLQGESLLGFSFLFAIDGISYAHQAFIGDAGRRLHLDLLCFHAEASIAQRTANVHTLVNGLHARENEGLCSFKKRQGLIVADYPSLTTLHPAAGTMLRYLRPHQYYRLTGSS